MRWVSVLASYPSVQQVVRAEAQNRSRLRTAPARQGSHPMSLGPYANRGLLLYVRSPVAVPSIGKQKPLSGLLVSGSSYSMSQHFSAVLKDVKIRYLERVSSNLQLLG